ncbi:MAG: hypothetical protein WCC74_00640 [Minisyncoccia bacterium]
MNLDDIYTLLGDAKKELKRRRKDPVLKKKIEDYLGENLPEVLKNEPRAMFFRAVLTPNFETKYFLDIAEIIGFKPVCIELCNDHFCTMNKDKVHLGKLVFLHKSGGKGCDLIRKKIIIDFHKSEKKSFQEIKTFNNKSFVEFHHNLYKKQYEGIMDIFDASILKKKCENAKDLYEKIFTLCLVNGVLFENFIAKENEHEKKFSENVVLPAFESVYKKFNLKPLVVPLLPLKDEEKESWIWYPGHLEKETDFLNKIINI